MNRHAGRPAGAGHDFTGPIAWMARHSIASNLLMILLIGGLAFLSFAPWVAAAVVVLLLVVVLSYRQLIKAYPSGGGDYEEAVTHLERAVQLSPEDAVLNDHLGDAYWKVGRTREAVFQWTHARDLGAEGDALALIVEKIANGLPAQEETKVPG